MEGHSCTLENVEASNLAKKAVAAVANPSVEIVDTDTFSYAVLQFCNSYGVAHQQDFVVLTRLKEPAMFTKQQILKTLRQMGLADEDITGMSKSLAVECWGEDMHV